MARLSLIVYIIKNKKEEGCYFIFPYSSYGCCFGGTNRSFGCCFINLPCYIL